MKIFSEFIIQPCIHCGIKKSNINLFCDECFKLMPVIKDPFCYACGAEQDGIFEICGKCMKEPKRPWRRALSLMRMEGCGKELIHKLKYSGNTTIARSFGEMAVEKILNSELNGFDFIVPIPLHWKRYLKRGYNQTELISDVISKKLKIPVGKILKRVKSTPYQAKLDRVHRLKNLDGAFKVVDEKKCENRTILLVDDVMTTGTTLSVATEVLLKSKIKDVYVLSIFRA